MRRNLFIRSGCVLWFALATIPTLGSQQELAVAHVLDVEGDWRLQGTTGQISAGQGLPAGATVIAESNRTGDAITIVRDEDMSRIWVPCDSSTTNPCRNPIVVADASATTPPTEHPIRSIVASAISILLSKPPEIENHFAVTLSRGRRDGQKFEDVIALDPAVGGIVLPPAEADVPAGQYSISIWPAGKKSAATERTVVLTSEGLWKPIPFPAAGLFKASITNARGEQIAEWMLLVVPQARYQALRESLEAMRSRTATWAGPSARNDEHLFLRALLLSETPR
jgi:hypothetical protein